jgi:hypothetical protein
MRRGDFPGTMLHRQQSCFSNDLAFLAGWPEILLDKTQRLGYASTVDKKLIARVMAELGRRTSKAKTAAARENGKKGGRPRKKVKR